MFSQIKNRIEAELPRLLARLDRQYRLRQLSPLLFASIKDFLSRRGKRIRPILFLTAYQGVSNRHPRGLYTTALAIELLHDFMLVHDDIIDKSDTRRNEPSMHAVLNKHLAKYSRLKFNGQDLSIVVGDVMYAMAIDVFLAIDEDPQRKEEALKIFTRAAASTGAGEFIELLAGTKPLDAINKDDIYKIYDYKTARYTFCAPLSTGATLAGADRKNIAILNRLGIYLGRTFQIKDDILGMFGDEKKIGKSTLSDLQEAKKTLLVWYAYNQGSRRDKKAIKNIFSQKKISHQTLTVMKTIVQKTGALDYAKKEAGGYLAKAKTALSLSCLKSHYKDFLMSYLTNLLAM